MACGLASTITCALTHTMAPTPSDHYSHGPEFILSLVRVTIARVRLVGMSSLTSFMVVSTASNVLVVVSASLVGTIDDIVVLVLEDC